jgi:hypothetical protein
MCARNEGAEIPQTDVVISLPSSKNITVNETRICTATYFGLKCMLKMVPNFILKKLRKINFVSKVKTGINRILQ